MNQAGTPTDAWGDMQNDCRVVADDGASTVNGRQINGNDPPPCWCTQC
jgi:hypothetical protein